MEIARLRRSTTDARIGGVCVMLADRWGIDPLLVRVAAVLLALSNGIGLVLYAAAWLAIPQHGSDSAPIDSLIPGARRISRRTWIVGLVIACIAVNTVAGPMMPFGIGPALVMAAVWYFGWYRPSRQRPETPKAPEPNALASRPFAEATPFTEAASEWQQRVQAYLAAQHGAAPQPAPRDLAADPGYSMDAFLALPDPVGLYAEPDEDEEAAAAAADDDTPAGTDQPTPPPATAGVPVPRRRPRRRTGRMHLIGWLLALTAVGVVAALDSSRTIPWAAYPAALLLALGIAHIIGAWLPRPRGLFFAAILLTLVTGAAAVPAELPSHTVSYASAAHLPAQPVNYGSGSMTADLSQVSVGSDTTYAVTVDAGELVVIVPRDTNVRVLWSVNVGDARILDQPVESGLDLGHPTESSGFDPARPTLTIEAHVTAGSLEVRR